MKGVIVIISVKIVAIVCALIVSVAVFAIWIVVAIVNHVIIAGFGFVTIVVIVDKLNDNIFVKMLCIMILLILLFKANLIHF